MADRFDEIFGQSPDDRWNSVFGPVDEEERKRREQWTKSPVSSPDPGVEALGNPELGRIRADEERREARRAAKEREEATYKPESTADFYASQVVQGSMRFAAGLNKTVGIALEVLGANEEAERQRQLGRERSYIAERPIEGETTGEDVWQRPTARNIANFIAETGLESVPEMGAAIAALPVYVASLSGNIADSRAENDLRNDPNGMDLLKALPFAAVSGYLDRLPLEAMFAGTLGKTALRRIAAGVGVEGITEGIQEGVEYTGSTLGTEKGFDSHEAIKSAILGSIAGAGMGGSIAGVAEVARGGVDAYGRRQEERQLGEIVGEPFTDPRTASQAFSPGRDTVAPAADPYAMERGAPLVTPEDVASPLPTDLIQEGKGAATIAVEEGQEDEILRQFAMPKVGSDVVVQRGPDGLPEIGKVLGSFTVGDQQGQKHGIRVEMGDGSVYEELFDDIQRGGQSIKPLDSYMAEQPVTNAGGIGPTLEQEPQISATSQPGETGTARDVLKAKIKRVESGGKVNAKNPRSSASGLYQFTKGTWEALGGNWEQRFDPALQEQMMDRLVDQNEAALQKAGFAPTAGNLYLAHFLGAGGAVKALRDPNGRPSEDVVEANPFLAGWTNAQIAAWADKKMGGAGVVPAGSSFEIDFDAWLTDEAKDEYELDFPARAEAIELEEPEQSYTEKANAARIRVDNPGGDWLEQKRANAEEDFKPTRPISGPITAHTEEKVLLDPAFVASLPGARGEKRQPGESQYDRLAAAVDKEGYNDEGAVLIGVNHRGDPYVIEGNTRAAVARDRGIKGIPAEVRWFSGGEQIDGALTPAKVKEIASPIPQGEARTEAEPAPELTKQDQLKAKMAEKRAATAAEQPDMFGGATKTAAEIDAERFAPEAVEIARDEDSLDRLHDEAIAAIEYGTADAKRFFSDTFTNLTGRKIAPDEAPAFANAVLDGIAAEAGWKRVGANQAGLPVLEQPDGRRAVRLQSGEMQEEGRGVTPEGRLEKFRIIGDSAAKPAESDWQQFGPETGTLGIPRAEMPQIKGEDRGAMVNFLEARGVTHEDEAVPASQLKPTQAEWSPAKAASWDRGNVKLEERAILASSDGHILDGHHQWIKAQERGEEIRIIRLNKPIRELLPLVREFPSARLSEGATKAVTPARSKQGELKAKIAANREAREAAALDYDTTDRDERVRIMQAAGVNSKLLAGGPKKNSGTPFRSLPETVQTLIQKQMGHGAKDAGPVEPKSREEAESALESGRKVTIKRSADRSTTYQLKETPENGWTVISQDSDSPVQSQLGGGMESWSLDYAAKRALEQLEPFLPKEGSPKLTVTTMSGQTRTVDPAETERKRLELEAEDLRNEAEPFQRELVAWGRRFDPDYGFMDPGLKSAERIIEKLEKEGYESLDEIKDVARVGFKIESQYLATDLWVSAQRTFGAENVTDKRWQMVDGDYFDRKLVISKDGIKAEIQIVPNAIEEFRHKDKREGYEGEGAELYREWRTLHRAGDPRAAEPLAKMEAGYANAVAGTSWESLFNELKSARGNALRAADSESRTPILETSPGAGTQRSAEDQTSAQPRPEAAPSATNLSSTSKSEKSATASDIGASETADKQAAYGASNRYFTAEAAEKARAIIRDKLKNQVSSGIDPEMLAAGVQIAGFHIEAGARKFATYAKAMVDDFGRDVVPYLRSWYEAIRYDPRAEAFAKEMSGPEEIGAALANLEQEAKSGIDAVEETSNAGTTLPGGARADDRGRDEGTRATDLQEPEGERSPADGAPREGGASGSDLQRDVRSRADEDAQVEEPRKDERAAAGEDASGTDRAGSGRRVRGKRADRGSNFTASPGSLKRSGSWKATAERNLEIVELVNRLEAEGRNATPDEQALLAKFTGWGAGEIRNNLLRNTTTENGEKVISKPYYAGEWSELIEKARGLLKGEELEQALKSVQYAHYTGEDVVRPMWEGIKRLGFTGGRILEPGMGIGNFFIAAPEDVTKASVYTGVEMDSFTAKIAKHLLPQENVLHADFIKQQFPDGFFDVAIGNPPFADITVLSDPAYKKQRFLLHDYFIAKSIDKVRPGGLAVFVVSKGTMDKLDKKARQYIADRADLLGAIRLPQTAFKENAGTEVVTDILFFQRRAPGQEAGGEAWLGHAELRLKNKDGKTEKYLVNEYFKAHPEMVLGRHALTGSMYRENEYTVEPYATKSISKQLAEAVARLPEGVYTDAPAKAKEASQAKTFERDFAPASEKEGGLYTKDGKLFVRSQGSGLPVEAINAKLSAKDKEWLKGYVKLRDALKEAQKAQLDDAADWEAKLDTLRKVYRGFLKKHGPINAFTKYERSTTDEDGEESATTYYRWHNKRLLDLDVEGPLVLQLEKISDEDEIGEGAFLKGRTLNKPARPKIESAQDALAVTLDEIGRVDLDYAAKLFNVTREQIVEALGDGIYEAPGQGWQTSDEYLSGDVLTKLEEAEAAAASDERFERNVDALLKVQPKPLSADQIAVKLGAGWIPEDVINKFADDELGMSAGAAYDVASGTWHVDTKGNRYLRNRITDYGTNDRSPLELLDALLNNRPIKITRTENDGGSKKTVVDPAATAAANEAATKISDRFKAWIWTDAKRAKALTDIYNRKFNNIAPRAFNGDHLTLPGLTANFKPHPHVKRAVWRIIQTGNTYLGHAVGAGKTAEQIISAMEQKRLGLIKKPMFVVPNHMLNQFAREFLELYPAANIMVADEAAFHTGNRRRFMAQAALNDPDAIIVTHSSFGKLETKPETKAAVVNDLIEELEAALEDAKAGDNARIAVRDIQKRIEQLKQRFEGKQIANKDNVLSFEEMGVDFLYVDEAHEFRKLDFSTARQVKGITPTGSQKALDLFIKTRWLDQNNPGRSLVMASGTPVTNTMAELYTVMRYMNQRGLERDGLQSFDAWANMFGEVASSYERNAAGKYELVERFAKFMNVPELMKRVRTFMDVLTNEQLGGLVQRPAIKGKIPENVIVEPSAQLKRYMEETLDRRIKISREWKPSPQQPGNPDPLINIITDARLATIDARFFADLKNDPGSKLNKMLDQIIAKHKEFKNLTYIDPRTGAKDIKRGGVQIVFSAVGFGEDASTNRGFDIKGWINQRLTEGGLKKSEIAWMSDANSHSKKEALQKAVRAGVVKVLIGSPKNMGTGLNVQRRLKVLHYLSPPWYPSDVEQPHGRIVRQGNLNEEVEIYWYATKGTYDSTQWQMVSRKQKFIEQALSGDDSIRTLEDISEASQYEMAAALAAGDERVIQVAGLSSEIERLRRLKSAHGDQQRELASEQRDIEKYGLPTAEKDLRLMEAADKARGTGFKPFDITVGNTTYDKHGEAGKALLDRIAKVGFDKEIEIGKLFGEHPISVVPGRFDGFTIAVTVGGTQFKATDEVDNAEALDPVGLAQRIQNKVQQIPSSLASARSALAQHKARLKEIENKLGAPFEYESDLNEKVAERARLQEELAKEGEEDKVAEPAAPAYARGDEAAEPLRRDSAALPVRRGGAVRALGIAEDLRRERSTALVGRAIGSTQELAEVAQVYRDPRVETLRVFFVKDGKVVHATGVSARSSSMAPLLPAGLEQRFPEWLREQMGTTGADGYYLLHNHPSGDPVPSGVDIRITKATARDAPGFLGHVVINSGRYGVIDKEGSPSVHELNVGEDGLFKPAKPHPLLGTEISNWKRLGEVGKALQQDGFVTVLGVDSKNKLRVIVDHPASSLERKPLILLGALRRIMRMSGSTRLFVAGTGIDLPAVREAIRNDVLTDAVDNGESLVGRHGLSERERPPQAFEEGRAAFVAEQGAGFTPASPEFSDPASEKRYQEASKGVGSPSKVDKAIGFWEGIKQGFSRHWKHLPNEARFANVQQQLRKLEAAHDSAIETTVRHLRELTKPLSKKEYDVFKRKVLLDDLMWEADSEHELPFGLTPATLRADLARLDSIIQTMPKVTEAVRKRKLFNRRIADKMVEAGVLTAEQVKNPAYYRHMVLDYARAEAMAWKKNRGSSKKVQTPYWAKRMGSTLDINANYLEAEFDWLLKAQVDIAMANTIEWIKKSSHNIRDDLRARAKADNKAKVAAIIAEDSDRGKLAKKIDGKFRSNIKRGLDMVKAELPHLVVPPHLRAAADALTSGSRSESVFPLLAWIMDESKPGAMGAAMVMKAVGLRRAWEQALLKDAYVDPNDVEGLVRHYKPEGMKAWQPREGRHFFTAKTISQHALDMFAMKLGEQTYPGVDKAELERALQTIKPRLMVGGERYTMVLPEELVDTLDGYGDRNAENLALVVVGELQAAWKRWVLINPRRYFKYNLNNMTGDLDAIIAGNPGTLRYVGQAAREIYNVWRGKQAMSDSYREAMERGVFTSGLSAQEIPDINNFSGLRQLERGKSNRPDRLAVQTVANFWHWLQTSTNYREAVFRYAAYLDYKAKIDAGTPQLKIGYGASVPKMVDAVTDPADRAALLARDLIGDYGAISVAGAWLRRYLIPFWSWTEINTKRYYRLTANGFRTSYARGIATGGLMGGMIAARTAATLYIRMGVVFALVNLWNMLLFGDEEDDLSEQQKNQLHLILGRDSDGQVITLRTQGALSDVLDMFGFFDAVQGIKRWSNGQGTLGQAAKDTVLAPVNRVGTATSPIWSVPFEQAIGKELWPDLTNPRLIHDRWRHVFSTFSLENEYDALTDQPSRGYGRSWTESFVYRRDPGEMAYNDARSMAYEWLENVKGMAGGEPRTSPRSEALRDYKMALRFGDPEAADKALEEYAKYDGTVRGLKSSIRSAHPLAPIAKKDRREFVQSLTDEQFETLLEAEQFYVEVYLGGGGE